MIEATAESKKLPGGREAYVFDPQEFDMKTQEIIRETESWHRWEPIIAKEKVEEDRESRSRERQWLKKFSGQIPKTWGEDFFNVKNDVQDPRVPLTDIQITAAIEYPSWHIQRELGQNHRLTPMQLALLAKRDTISSPLFNIITERQKIMGTDPDAVTKAIEINRQSWQQREEQGMVYMNLNDARFPPTRKH